MERFSGMNNAVPMQHASSSNGPWYPKQQCLDGSTRDTKPHRRLAQISLRLPCS